MNERDSVVLTTMVRYHLLLSQTATRRDLDDPATVSAVAHGRRLAPGARVAARVDRSRRARDRHADVGRLEGSPRRRSGEPDVGRARRRGRLPPPSPSCRPRCSSLPRPDSSPSSPRQRRAQPRSPWSRPTSLACCGGRPACWRCTGWACERRPRRRSARPPSPCSTSNRRTSPKSIRRGFKTTCGGPLRAVSTSRRSWPAARRPRRPASRSRLPPADRAAAGGASDKATVLEVRAHDRPGLLFAVTRALAAEGLDVRSARVETLGAEVVDAFYVTDRGGRTDLQPERAEAVRRAIEEALRGSGPRT